MKTAIQILDAMIEELNPEGFIPSNTDSIVTSYLREAKERIKKEDNQNYEMPNSTEALTDFLNRNGEKIVPPIQKETGWISVEDRLPDEGKTFIYLTGNGKVMVASNRILDDWFIRKYSVTHWTYPLPLPPNE